MNDGVPMGNGWLRTGGCDAERCGGRCCTLIAFMFERGAAHEELLDFFHKRGCVMRDVETEQGKYIRLELDQRCQHLTDEGLCAIYGQPERPQVCIDYPKHPTDIIGLEEPCGYAFEPAAKLAVASEGD